jgi:predicted nucleotidyltransferase
MTDSEIIQKVAKIVRQEVKQDFRLFLFGSRADETNDARSDVDIGILAGNPISAKSLFTIREKIDEIPTLLKIDFLDFAAVDDEFQNAALKNAKEISLREDSLPLPTDAL